MNEIPFCGGNVRQRIHSGSPDLFRFRIEQTVEVRTFAIRADVTLQHIESLAVGRETAQNSMHKAAFIGFRHVRFGKTEDLARIGVARKEVVSSFRAAHHKAHGGIERRFLRAHAYIDFHNVG